MIYDTYRNNAWVFSFVTYQTFGVGKHPVILATKQVPLDTSGDPPTSAMPYHTLHITIYSRETSHPRFSSLSKTLRLSDSEYEVRNEKEKGKDGSDDDFKSRYVFHFISIYVIGALMHIESYPLRSNMIRGYSVLSIIVHVCLQSKYLSISVRLRNAIVTNPSTRFRLSVSATW